MDVRRGVCWGVGVGPGDPELITLKAVHVLERCPVIAAPRTRSGGTLALDIVRGTVDLAGKTVLPLEFTMEQEQALLRAAHERAADAIQAYLDQGQDVAVLNLGDVSIYATWGYLMDVLNRRGYETAMVPGVPSFCAAAARLGATLARWGSPLHIIPVGKEPVEPLVSGPGGKVLMKAGRSLPEIVEALRRTGQLRRAALVENCGLPAERVRTELEYVPEDVGYFATVIVKEEG